MGDPGYDFFATGPAQTPSPAAPSAAGTSPETTAYGMTVNRFGSPADLGGASPVTPLLAPAPAAAPQFPIEPAAGYQPGAVNQFGTPIDLQAAPTGPYAAPGVAAIPTAGPGLVTAWDARGATPPGHSRARAVPASLVPASVRTASIISIIVGCIGLAITLVELLGYLALQSDVASAVAADKGAAALTSVASTILLVFLVIQGLLSGLSLVAGAAGKQGRRWAVWTMLVVSAINVLVAFYDLTQGGSSLLAALLTFAISGSILALLLKNESRSWLMQG